MSYSPALPTSFRFQWGKDNNLLIHKTSLLNVKFMIVEKY